LWWFFPPDRLERVKDRNGDLVFDVRRLADEGGALKVLQQVRAFFESTQNAVLIRRKERSSSSRPGGTIRC
jgi:hypothetical protein